MKEIIIDDQIVLIDDEDFDYINTFYDLYIDGNGYVKCKQKEKYKKGKMGLFSLSLHKILVFPYKAGRGITVDHIDGNKLNNQKGNLRVCTHQENMWNSTSRIGGSKYKGVSFHKPYNCWNTKISKDGIKRDMGLFKSEIAAANAYNFHAKRLFGDFARLNDVPFMRRNEWEEQRISKNKTSKYRGVSFIHGKWIVQIWDGKKKKNIVKRGFQSEDEAALAYNELAIKIKGKRAMLNDLND